jgi:hypothetical protein
MAMYGTVGHLSVVHMAALASFAGLTAKFAQRVGSNAHTEWVCVCMHAVTTRCPVGTDLASACNHSFVQVPSTEGDALVNKRVQAWDVRNSCKHHGAVLPLSAAPVGRGADGVDAMA